MAKKSRAARKKATQALQANSIASSTQDSTSGLASRLEDATSSFTTAFNDVRKRVPQSAIYWGLGGLAVGALAFGAYCYRKQLVEVYDRSLEVMDMGNSQPVARKSKSSVSSKTAAH